MKNRIKAKAVTQLSRQFSGLKVATENKTIKGRRQRRERERDGEKEGEKEGTVMKRRDKRAEDKGECNSRVDGRFAVV